MWFVNLKSIYVTRVLDILVNNLEVRLLKYFAGDNRNSKRIGADIFDQDLGFSVF